MISIVKIFGYFGILCDFFIKVKWRYQTVNSFHFILVPDLQFNHKHFGYYASKKNKRKIKKTLMATRCLDLIFQFKEKTFFLLEIEMAKIINREYCMYARSHITVLHICC